jgi:hypothetical protein
MRHFTAAELERMQSTQSDAMQDICELLVYAPTPADDYGMPQRKYVVRQSLECGIEHTRQGDAMGQGQVAVGDAVLRLPIDTDLTNVDRITVYERFGTLQASAKTYEIMGDAKQGPSGLVLDLRQVTDGSDAS